MNPDQITGQARTFLAFFGGIAAGLGWTWWAPVSTSFLDALGPVLQAVGPVMGFAASVWSLIKWKQGNVLTSAATMMDTKGKKLVQTIEMAPTHEGIALAQPSVTPTNVVVAPAAFGTPERRF